MKASKNKRNFGRAILLRKEGKFIPIGPLRKESTSHKRGRRSSLYLAAPSAKHRPHMFFKRLLYYLNPATLFTKTDANRKMQFMNGVNRFSIFVFLICLVVMIVRALTR